MPVSPATLTAAAPAADSPDGRILAAAQRQLFAYGYNALTMDDLAHELGISKKTLYLHFPGKDAIISIVIDGVGRVIRSGMETVLNDPKLTFAQKLRGIVDVVAPRLAQTSPAMLRELQRYAPSIHQKIDELRQKNIPYVFSRLFRAGIAEGAVRADLDPDFAAQFWLQVMRGLTHPDTLAITHLTPRQTLEKALELFTGGLLTPVGRKDYEKLFPR
ncbi:MAG: TetR/AcrR family transcriptional regulator [Opitutaceae bacterium]